MAERKPGLTAARNWVFDLDNTLYPAGLVFPEMERRMTQFVAGFLGIDPQQAARLQQQYYLEHGTTLKGMMDNHAMAPGSFLHHVHEVDLSPVPRCNLLARAIDALPGRKFIYTNGSRRHAERMAAHLGIDHLFDGMTGIDDGAYHPKPDPRSYDQFCETHVIDPGQSMFFEDVPRNLRPAHDMGFTTVLVTSHSSVSGDAEHAVSIANGDAAGAHIHYVTSDLASFLAAARPEWTDEED